MVLAHLQISLTLLKVVASSEWPQFISLNVYRLSTVIHISHRAGKQNKFLTVKYTLPGTGTQVSTCNLILSRYCVSGNMVTLPGKLTLNFPCVFITTLTKKPALKNIKMKV